MTDTNSLTIADLDRLERLEQQATKGPWENTDLLDPRVKTTLQLSDKTVIGFADTSKPGEDTNCLGEQDLPAA